MLEDFLSKIGTLSPLWIYISLFFFSYIENVFPPSPSDLVVIVAGSLIAQPEIEVYFIPTLILTSIGSVLGFMTLFYLGAQLDKKVIRTGKIKFISIEALGKAEQWFLKYGYFVILANRFLPGTRSVISFFAGLSELNVKKTIILASISAFVWNAIMLYVGRLFGSNIDKIDYYLSTYSNIVIAVTALVVIVLVLKYFLTKKEKKSELKLFFWKNRIPITPDEKIKQKRERLLLILSGLLLGLSFPPLPVPQLLLVGLVPYFYVLESREKLIKINQATYLMAFVFSLVTLYWVGSWQSTADPFLMISGVLLVFINPVFFLIPSTIYYFCKKSFNKKIALFLLPFFWVAYEYVYMLTDASFPWIALGNGLVKFLSFIQVADIIGSLGLSILVIYINIFLYRAFTNYKADWKKYYTNLSIAVLLIIIPIIYGLIRVSTFNLSKEKIKVGLVQPNLDPWDKWAGGNIDRIVQLHFDLSQKAINKGAELIIWPETAFPVYLFGGTYPATVNSVYNFIRTNNVYLLTGMPDIRFYPDENKKPEDAKYNESGDYYYATYNAILLISPETSELQRYGKMKLVPFGERVPFVETIPFLGSLIKWSVGISGWNVGNDTINFSIPSGHFNNFNSNDSLHINGLVCYESIYPYFIANFVQRGAEFIAVVTNDSWYGKLSGPYQHKEYAVLRAIENRRSVVRAANGGVSCIINPLGITETETEMFEQTFIAGDVIIQGEMTFFTKYPLIIPLLSSAVSVWMIGLFLLKKLKIKLKL